MRKLLALGLVISGLYSVSAQGAVIGLECRFKAPMKGAESCEAFATICDAKDTHDAFCASTFTVSCDGVTTYQGPLIVEEGGVVDQLHGRSTLNTDGSVPPVLRFLRRDLAASGTDFYAIRAWLDTNTGSGRGSCDVRWQ